jgi:hypothetical protein
VNSADKDHIAIGMLRFKKIPSLTPIAAAFAVTFIISHNFVPNAIKLDAIAASAIMFVPRVYAYFALRLLYGQFFVLVLSR